MTQLADASCLIKVLGADNTVLPDGGTIFTSDAATVRYVIFNDSDLPMGPMTVSAKLFRNGLRIRPDPVPIQGLTLKPNEVWTHERTVLESFGPNGAKYQATLVADLGRQINEEDEANNSAQASFTTVQF